MQVQLNPDKAIQYLDKAAQAYKGTRDDHLLMAESVKLLRRLATAAVEAATEIVKLRAQVDLYAQTHGPLLGDAEADAPPVDAEVDAEVAEG